MKTIPALFVALLLLSACGKDRETLSTTPTYVRTNNVRTRPQVIHHYHYSRSDSSRCSYVYAEDSQGRWGYVVVCE